MMAIAVSVAMVLSSITGEDQNVRGQASVAWKVRGERGPSAVSAAQPGTGPYQAVCRTVETVSYERPHSFRATTRYLTLTFPGSNPLDDTLQVAFATLASHKKEAPYHLGDSRAQQRGAHDASDR